MAVQETKEDKFSAAAREKRLGNRILRPGIAPAVLEAREEKKMTEEEKEGEEKEGGAVKIDPQRGQQTVPTT